MDRRRTTEIEKEFTFEAAHRLPNVPEGHKCARLHGHSFRVRVTVQAPIGAPSIGDETGWIVDFAALTRAWTPLHEMLDHRYLNEVKGLENPTSELLAHFVLDRLVVEGARVVAVRVSETCTSACVVRVSDEGTPR
jgi:6-pyruvoyltetrahydropterin/6-carboxytetrahydropterin synthase